MSTQQEILSAEASTLLELFSLDRDPESLYSRAREVISAISAERDALAKDLKRLQDKTEFITERRAQISHRLWVWAHEELSEPLKTRYFNIVANGTADVMEQPTYAQQYNGQKYRAEAAEAERDSLRAEIEKLQARASLPAVEPVSQWQPIETAPKDGTVVVLGRVGDDDVASVVTTGHWQKAEEDGVDYMGSDAGFVDEHYQEFSPGRSFGNPKYMHAPSQPTHWQPIPQPPKEPA